MKIAIITSGRLPVPATKGGAVETKLDYILEYNAKHHIHDITVYSVKPDKSIDKSTQDNHYVHFNMNSLYTRIGRLFFKHSNKAPYYSVDMEYFLYLCIKKIKNNHFDCIIIANRPGFVLKLRKTINTFVVNQINNDYISQDTSQACDIKESSSLIITCSDYLNRRVCQVKCKKEIPVVTVHNGIDIKRFSNAKSIDRTILSIKNDDFVIFYSGRLTKEKGILELIQAIKLIKAIPALKLIIAGASFYGKESQMTSYIRKLKEEADDIKKQVIFTGYIDYSEMPSYLKTANVIVVPSLWEEPFGLTVLEAMASGIPLITTRCGGIPEVCKDTAILVERENISKNVAEAILYLYNNPQEAKQIAQKAEIRSWLFDKSIFARNYFNAIDNAYKQI